MIILKNNQSRDIIWKAHNMETGIIDGIINVYSIDGALLYSDSLTEIGFGFYEYKYTPTLENQYEIIGIRSETNDKFGYFEVVKIGIPQNEYVFGAISTINQDDESKAKFYIRDQNYAIVKSGLGIRVPNTNVYYFDVSDLSGWYWVIFDTDAKYIKLPYTSDLTFIESSMGEHDVLIFNIPQYSLELENPKIEIQVSEEDLEIESTDIEINTMILDNDIDVNVNHQQINISGDYNVND